MDDVCFLNLRTCGHLFKKNMYFQRSTVALRLYFFGGVVLTSVLKWISHHAD